MWLIFALISVVSCIAGFLSSSKNRSLSMFFSGLSLSMTAMTLLMEYRDLNEWIITGNEGALTDVAPSMTSILMTYTVGMILMNMYVIIKGSITRK